MRMATELVEPRAPERAPELPVFAPRAAPRRGLDWCERSVLVAFGIVSVWVLGLDLWQVIVDGRTWTGTDGLFLTDQMQYLAWIQSASRQVLASDLFVVHASAADYLQPLIAVSGALTAFGVAAWLSLLLWQPVAVLAMFFAARQKFAPLQGRAGYATLALLLISAGGLVGCATIQSSAPAVTPKGAATIIVTATSGGNVKPTVININVN